MGAPPSCFAALTVPPTPAVEALVAALPPELRRIHVEDTHLTVAYFGRVDPALHPVLLSALGEIDFGGATVELGALLPLPSREWPTAITLALAPGPGRDAVVDLMATHRPPLLELAERPPETRPPLPHVTFARPRGRRMAPPKRDAILAWTDAQSTVGCEIRLGRVVLMRSRPHRPEGPHYEVLEPPRSR